LKFIVQKETHKNKFITKLALMLVMTILLQSFIMLGVVNAAITSNLSVTIYRGILTTGTTKTTGITLNWNDNLTDEKYYTVERKEDSGAFQIIASQIAANTTSFHDGTVSDGFLYTYRVSVTDTSNTYLYTPELSFRTDEIEIPNSLTITPITDTQIDVKWGYPNQKAYNTIIERKAEGDTNWSQIANVGMGINTYSDKSIASGIKYLYRVKACTTENVKSAAYPEEGSATYSLLLKPTELYGFVNSQKLIQLSWKDNSAEKAFIIERRSSDKGVFQEIDIAPENTNVYIDSDKNLKPNLIYSYRIKAVSGTTSSEYSDIFTLANTYLKTPGTLSSSCADGKSIQLAWQDLSDSETGFEIWRKTGSSLLWELYDTMGRNATTYTDLSISPQDTYSYKIRAKINDNSVYSDFSNLTTVWSATIAAPANLTYEVVGKTEIKLSWQDTSMVEAGLKVERRIGFSGEWYVIGNLGPNIITFNDKWINNTDFYFYRIKVFDRSNSINYSDEIMVSLKTPEVPTDLQANPISSSEVQLTWKDNSSNESEFVIEAMQFYTFKEIGRVSRDTTTFVYSNISPDKTLTFRVRAVCGSNQSESSKEVVATTKRNITYTDLGDVEWAVKAINNLASRNVFDAKQNSKFYPNQNITRGEYLSIIIRSLELNKVTAGRFADVTSKNKYYKEIMTAYKLGIISPDKNNKIYPNNAITREQAGVILALALKIKGTPLPAEDGSSLKQFSDYRSISPASAEKIAAVCGAGILSGRTINGKTYLQLGGYVTRAEAAVIAYKAINLK
jgi:hypothetical protein